MGWVIGLLAGALIGVGSWAVSHDAGTNPAAAPAPPDSRRAGAPAELDDDRPFPLDRRTRLPASAPGSEGDDREIRPPVQRGPDDFYRKPPRERKPRDRMFA